MPRLAAFPKAFMDDLCVTGAMTLRQWIELASTLDIDGIELYSGFLDLADPTGWPTYRSMAADHGLAIPMLCCSPDFAHPDPAFRQEQVAQEKRWIELAAAVGARYCRVLSGQRRPGLSVEEGIGYVVGCIEECLEHARPLGVTLVIENHYKDDYWTYPEFAQKMDVFCALVDALPLDGFGVNFDPSNTIIAGEDPLELLERVKHRVQTMHASDRYVAEGTIEDLRREEDSVGYAARLRHGEIGTGLNDYDAIFATLAGVGFDGWISIEDGVDGMDQLHRSVAFLRDRIAHHWPAQPVA